MTRFNMFTDEELDALESTFLHSKELIYLVNEIRRERRYRDGRFIDANILMSMYSINEEESDG